VEDDDEEDESISMKEVDEVVVELKNFEGIENFVGVPVVPSSIEESTGVGRSVEGNSNLEVFIFKDSIVGADDFDVDFS